MRWVLGAGTWLKVIDGVSRPGDYNNLFSLAKHGLLGLVVLLAVYLLPMRFFAKELGVSDLSLRATATAGVLLPVTYIDFGLTPSFLSHNSGVMLYAFLLAVCFGVSIPASVRRLCLRCCDLS